MQDSVRTEQSVRCRVAQPDACPVCPFTVPVQQLLHLLQYSAVQYSVPCVDDVLDDKIQNNILKNNLCIRPKPAHTHTNMPHLFLFIYFIPYLPTGLAHIGIVPSVFSTVLLPFPSLSQLPTKKL